MLRIADFSVIRIIYSLGSDGKIGTIIVEQSTMITSPVARPQTKAKILSIPGAKTTFNISATILMTSVAIR